MRFLVIATLVLALAACGGGVTPLTAAQVKACSVRVYFRSNATHAQENAVAAKLREDSRVVSLTFISKAQALAKMRKKYPSFFKVPLVTNPLPDSYTAVPDQLSDRAGIAASMHLPGVANINGGSPLPHLCSA